jgi:ABC-type arginine/histidine transport system permease subunit
MKAISEFVFRNPWIYIVLAFVLLLAAWSTLISIAVKHTPQQIEVKR